jgi:VCBS repeat-containing protein
VVAATGNDGSTLATYPAGDRGVVGVASTDASDALAASSNRGAAAFMAAPGEGIVTTAAGGGVASVSGTSAAAAEVAGAAALLRALDPSASNGMIVGRMARNADPVSSDGAGNGRLNLARAAADTSTESVQPDGAAPYGDGGPFVGPYVIAARNWVLSFAGSGVGTVTITPSTGTVNAPVACGGTGLNASSQTVSATCLPNITTSDNAATVTLLATPGAGSAFGGWSGASSFGPSCSGMANPCGSQIGSNGQLTVTFTASNSAPVCADGSRSATEDTSLSSSVSCTDADGDALTYSKQSEASHGSVSLDASGSFTYAPHADFNGTDSFTFKANDGTADSATKTITITVAAVNDDPIAVDDTASTSEDTQLVIDPATLLTNDRPGPTTATDEASQTLSVTAVSNPLHGTILLDAGGATFTPDANFFGNASFDYTISDGAGGSDTGTVAVAVSSVNDDPTISDIADQTIDEDGDTGALSFTITDVETAAGDLAVSASSSDTSLVPNANIAFGGSGTNRTVTVTPAANKNGAAMITVTVEDADGATADQTFTITVTPVNDVPSASDDTASMNEDGAAIELDLRSLVSDVETDDANLTYTIVSGPTAAQGTLTPDATDNGVFSFDSAADFNGTVTITYSVTDRGDPDNCGAPDVSCDAAETSADQTFTITVTPVNDAPSFTKGADQTVLEDAAAQSVSGWATSISAGPADESAQILTFNVSNDNNALFSVQPAIAADGTLTYTPAADANGSATVTVSLSDDGGTANGGDDTSADQTFTITVTPVNDAPTLGAISDIQLLNSQTKTINLYGISAGPANESSQVLSLAATSSDESIVKVTTTYTSPAATGTLTITPLATSCGAVTVTVYVKDDGGTEHGGVDTTARGFAATSWNGHFLSPLKEGTTNLVQKGQVVPVQVKFGCPDNDTGLSPQILLLNGDFVDNAGGEADGDALVTSSVSNADTTGFMRPVDGKYIYNLSVPKTADMKVGTKLTVRVRPLGTSGPSMYILLQIRK